MDLVYNNKILKEDLFANKDGIFPVSLQIEKTFNNDSDVSWEDILVFGDNLQFLKTIYENKDFLIKDKIKDKVKLIYIDPPFGTKNNFKGSDGQKAYIDKLQGAEFIEFLRRRLILAKEILSDDGSIFVHLDYRKGHYIKVLMDEIFGEKNFRNEIVWCYTGPGKVMKYFPRKHDYILFYTKTKNNLFNLQYISYKHGLSNTGIMFKNKERKNKELLKELENKGKKVEDWWIDIWATEKYRSELIGYPTQKPEKLLERIIKVSTNKGDLVMDFFCGSGTTLTVAEKLGRCWVGCDNGELAINITQKRLQEIDKSKDLENPKKKYNKQAKNFIIMKYLNDKNNV